MKVDDGWHRRQAVAIASTLPEDINDARKILQLSMELAEGFLSGGALSEGSALGGSVEANQPAQHRPMSPTATKLWLAAALVLSIIIPSPIFQGNSIFVSHANAAAPDCAQAGVPPG
jgi:hypothetical protein